MAKVLSVKIFFCALIVTTLIACAAPTALPAPASTAAPTPAATIPAAPFVREKFFLRELAGVGRHPSDVAALGDKIYILNVETENIAVIQNDRAVKFIPVGKQPTALAGDPAQKRLYVANAKDKTISLIMNDQITLTQNIGGDARALLFSENRLWAGLDSSGTVLALDPATLQIQNRITIPNAFSIISLAGDAINHRVYANAFEKTAVIDSNSQRLLNTLTIKGSYYTVAAHPPSDSALIAHYDAASATQFLAAYNPRTGAERGRVKLGGDPRGAIVNADGSRFYVANSFTNDISVIDPRTMQSLATISVGLAPYALALDESARRLYVANYESDSVSAINTDTNHIAATIPLAMFPTALEANETARRVYIANASSNSVFVVEGARVVKEISVGAHPADLARDAQSNRLFVANQADGTLSIIDENNFAVRSIAPIPRSLTTIAVDAPRARLFANDIVLDLNNFAPTGKIILRGVNVGSTLSPDWVRVNAAANRVYALGGNGVPGSNNRRVLYSLDAATLQQRATLSISGNLLALAVDSETHRVFGAGTHPFSGAHELAVWDANDSKIFGMPLAARATGIAYNPQTKHLFIAYAASATASATPVPNPAENTVQILDTTTFGEVARFSVNAPGALTRVGNLIYIAGRADGAITIIEDVSVPAPPAPSPTATLTPFVTPARTPTR